jgi:hypothetical protein
MNWLHREELIKDPEKGEIPRGFEATEEWVNYRFHEVASVCASDVQLQVWGTKLTCQSRRTIWA